MISLLLLKKINDINKIEFKEFPSTRYQGSKRKILPWLHDSFKEIDFHTVLDACGGSGSVSYLLKKMGKAVTYNDKLHFNYLIGKALIENQQYLLTEQDFRELINIEDKVVSKNLISKNFKGIYFLPKENEWLDKMTNNIVNMNHYQPEILQYKKALAYYAIFQSSMIKRPFNLFHRKNLNLRTNDVERNFGNKITWEKSFDYYFSKFVKEANSLIFNSNTKCNSINESIFNLDPFGYDLVYIDPPYIRKDGSNESSNYLRCYHFLEGISKYNEWEHLIDYDSINLQLKNIKEENDFRRDTIFEMIQEIIAKFKSSKIVFSYKKGGVPSIDFIVRAMKKHGKQVHTRSLHYKYALNHQNGDAEKNREVLIIGI